MIDAVCKGALGLDKLESLTAVCSVGLDMLAVPGTVPVMRVNAFLGKGFSQMRRAPDRAGDPPAQLSKGGFL